MTPLILERSCRYTSLSIDEPVDITRVDIVMMMLQLHRIVRAACQVAFP